MACWALVPVKARRECKSRLAPVLPPAERVALVRSMLSRVLGCLESVPAIQGISLLSPERDLVPGNIELLTDRGRHLNNALMEALSTLRMRGAQRIVVLPSDLPALVPTDIEALLEAAGDAGLGIAPDERDRGTNGLCIQTGMALRPAFGESSFTAHLREAARLGVAVRVVRTPGWAFDLDTPEALKRLAGAMDVSLYTPEICGANS